MKIMLEPQVWHERIYYEFDNDIVTVEMNGVVDVFDFSGLPDGILEIIDPETGRDRIETMLEIQPIVSAEKKSGILYLRLLNWISEDASYEERFPDWIDSRDYVAPVKEEDSGMEKNSLNDIKTDEVINKESLEKDAQIEDWSDF